METDKIIEGHKLLEEIQDLERKLVKVRTSIADKKVKSFRAIDSNNITQFSISNEELIEKISKYYEMWMDVKLADARLKLKAL